MDLWVQALCFSCAIFAAPPVPQIARADWGIRYTEESLGRGEHLLRLSASDWVIDRDEWRQRRLQAFAKNYADRACRGRYRLTASREPMLIRPTYAKQFVFRCG